MGYKGKKMTCRKIYRHFDTNYEMRQYNGCKELRDHYASLDHNETNPKYLEQIRDQLSSCPDCNLARDGLLQEYCPEKLQPDYKSPWLTDKH